MPLPIVICDDSSMARKQIARSLPEGWDVDITFATNGQEGVEAVRAGKADVLFLDLTMPVMDGYETLQALRDEGLEPMTVVVSGDIQPDARKRVMDMGALDFIKKPIDKERLEDTLKNFGILEKAPMVAPSAAKRPEVAIKVDRLDAYREVSNVAMGQAADLLARLLDVFVVLPVPNVAMLETSELHMALQFAEDEDTVSAVCQGFIGSGVAGEALLIFNDSSFGDFARLMKYQGDMDRTAELELLMDVGNILIGACLKGIADQLDIAFSQNHPTVLGQHTRISELIAANAGRWSKTLAIEINYAIEDHNIHCDLLLLVTEDSLKSLNDKVSHLM